MSITTSEIIKVDKEIKLPVAPDAKKKEKKSDVLGEGMLNIRWDGKGKSTFVMDGVTFETMEPLVDKLQKLKNANQQYRIIIRGDRNLPAVEIQKAMGVLGNAGLDNIAFSALNQE